MLDNWLQPSLVPILENHFPYKEPSFGQRIQFLGNDGKLAPDAQIAIVGINAELADRVRAHLYAMSAPFNAQYVFDLGNTRRQSPSFVGPLIKELLAGNIIPIIIASEGEIFSAQFHAYRGNRKSSGVVVVDSKIRLQPEEEEKGMHYLNKLIYKKRSHLFSLGVIGYQSHFVGVQTINFLTDNYFEHIRLGEVKADIQETEPVIRSADLFGMHFSSMKSSDAPGQEDPSPAGLTIEEFCQLSRYAGLSDKLTSFSLFGFSNEIDAKDEMTYCAAAQAIWYFLDGYFNRKKDFPVSTNDLTEYVVESNQLEQPIIFWKSTKSGRWWMQIPGKQHKKHERHYLAPCSYDDYLKASQGELSDRLLNSYRRFTE